MTITIKLKKTISLNIITDSNVDCSCHEYINANGYGQCKKGSSYEHVKGKKVCYVNQPSNCTDLTYSSTDPGKKFSAQACELEVKEEGNRLQTLISMIHSLNKSQITLIEYCQNH